MSLSFTKENDTNLRLCHQLFLTLGDPLRMVLDNAVKGLPLLHAAGEPIEDFTTFSSSLPVRFFYCFYSKLKEFQLEEQCVTFSLCFEYVKHVV